MIINKVTVGFVIQVFDDISQKFIRQEFVSGAEVSYEDAHGEPVECDIPYLTFDMVQPDELTAEDKLAEIKSALEEDIPDQRRLDKVLDILNTNC